MADGAIHVIEESELTALVNEINTSLANDPDMASRLPLSPPDKLWEASSDGLLFSKLLNATVENTLDYSRLNHSIKTPHHALENQNNVIKGAVKIGCKITNIGAVDLLRATEKASHHLVLGLLWQIIKVGLMNKLTVTKHPELIRLMHPGEELTAFLSIAPEDLLLRWVNYHLQKAESKRKMNNFSTDVIDSEIYATLLTQIAPDKCDFTVKDIVHETSMLKRAERVLHVADRIACRKFVTPAEIVSGHSRLNLAFIAHMFNTHPGIQLPSEEELLMMNQSKSQLFDRLTKLQQEMETQSRIITETRSKTSQLECDLEEVNSRYSALGAEKSALDAKLQALQSDYNTLSQERDLLTELSATLQESLDDMHAKAKTLEASVEQERGERTKEREEAQRAREELERAMADVRKELEGVNADKESLQTQLATLRHKHECFKDEYNALVNKLTTELAETKQAKEAEKTEADRLLKESEERTTEAVSQALVLKDQIQKLTQALLTVSKERDEARAQAAAYVSANERGILAFEQLRGNQEGALKMIQELTTKNHVLEEENKRQKASADRQIASQMDEIERLRRELQAMTADRDEWKRKYEKLDGEHHALDKKNNAHRAMLNHLTQQIQRNETHISHLKSLYNSYPSSKKLFHAIYPDRSRTMFEAKNGPYERHLMLHGALMRPSADKTKEAKVMHYLLVDNFLLGYKPGEDSKPHDVIRLDDAQIDTASNMDSTYVILITPAHHGEEPYQLQVENEPMRDAWVGVMKVASEWWTDNKHKRDLTFVNGPAHALQVDEY